jgi:hypothetical protein
VRENGSTYFSTGMRERRVMSGKWRPRNVLLRYCDDTELLLGPIRIPVDAVACASSRPTGRAAAGEGF